MDDPHQPAPPPPASVYDQLIGDWPRSLVERLLSGQSVEEIEELYRLDSLLKNVDVFGEKWYQKVDVTDWVIAQPEQMGSKDKVWLRSAYREDQLWLFKKPRRSHGEDWAEVVAADLARLIRVPRADVQLAVRKGERGTITKHLQPEKWKAAMSHGNDLLQERHPDYVEHARINRTSAHTVDRVLGVLSDPMFDPPPRSGPASVQSVLDAFVGYLMFDAWIGNTDRHHENWAVLRRPASQGMSAAAMLAPSYDHGSCLGRELSDEKREHLLANPHPDHNVTGYCRKTPSRFYLRTDDKKSLHPLEVFRLAAARDPNAAAAWLDHLASIAESDTLEVLDRVPPSRMSDTAKAFAAAVLAYNQAALLALPLP